MATKAIHIELVSDLTAEAFISALRRFVARRGNCKNIYSDNATCFVKANKLLLSKTELEMEEYDVEIRNELLHLNIQWHFSPPSGPHFNGLAEAAVKSIKTHLKKNHGFYFTNIRGNEYFIMPNRGLRKLAPGLRHEL